MSRWPAKKKSDLNKADWANVHKAINWYGRFVNETTLNDDKLRGCTVYDDPSNQRLKIYHDKVPGKFLLVPYPNLSHALIDEPVEVKPEE